jgi:hypothetical protein
MRNSSSVWDCIKLTFISLTNWCEASLHTANCYNYFTLKLHSLHPQDCIAEVAYD